MNTGFELLWRGVLVVVVGVRRGKKGSRMIKVWVRVEWFGQDVGGIFAGAYATDFNMAVGIILSNRVIADIHRAACFGEGRVRGKGFRSLVVTVSMVRLSRVAIEFQN